MADGGNRLFEIFPGVALRHIQQFAADAELGAGELHLAPRFPLRIGEEERVVDLLAEHDLVRDGVRGVVLREEGEKTLRALARALR